MLIRRLILENFGLFRGRNELDLAPQSRYGKVRPVILIGGKNGSGKSTLLEALRLCLYGPLALGSRVGERKYEEYLGDCIHRVEGGGLFQPHSASVAIDFDYAQAGVRHRYSVERSWDRQGSSVPSRLKVLRDGAPLDELDQAHAEDFLRDLIPPGVSQLFFFDGEKIQQLAETDQDHVALADAVRGLLGLELIDRLRGDLRTYAGRLERFPEGDPLRAELAHLVEERQSLEDRRCALTRQLDESRSTRDRIRKAIAQEEQRVARAGGNFASQREALKAERAQLQQTLKESEDDLRELAESLLPFMLASDLCRSLRVQLDSEAKIQSWEIHAALMQTRIEGMKRSAKQTLFPEGAAPEVAPKAQQQLIRRVSGWLDELAEAPSDLPRVALIHRLSDDDRKRLLGGIDQILGPLPRRLHSVQKRLERCTRRLREVEKALEKIPADDVLEPLLVRLRDLNRELGAAEALVAREEAADKEIEQRLEELARRDRKLQEKLERARALQGRAALAARVQAALQDYSAAMTKAKVDDLREAVVGCFAELWRKGDLVRRIEIDPTDFNVTLFDQHGRVVPKKQLSAGEKQIYAISVLRALAQASGRPLPMIIDTPLGRLDSDHRKHLVERYFPHASHQVVIFSTDTEIDRTYFDELAPSISHAYQLRYDPSDVRTVVENGYFWAPAGKGESHAG
jgi:DNA sulfur modification protein DndD